MEIKAGIVDDERKARELLVSLLNMYCPAVSVCFQCESIADATNEINNHSPDLLFLDVEMPGSSGFGLFQQVGTISFETVFVTAFSDYALDAFGVNAAGYLLKPVDPVQLVKVVKVVTDRIENRRSAVLGKNLETAMSSQRTSRIGIPTSSGVVFVDVNTIVRCEADSNYTNLFFEAGRKMVVSRTMKEFEAMLQPYHFCRVHKSHIVNLKHLTSYHKGENANLTMSDATTVPVSSQFKARLEEKLNII